uniref:MAGE family member A10 n=1 Tax=Nannospalax galili TaxID=1026970 RepID=A0A8C6RGA4_NANGA
MPRPQKRRRVMVEDLEAQSETVLIGEEDSSSSSTCSSSFPSSFSSTSSYITQMSDNPEENIAVSEALNPSQSPQIACSSLGMASSSDSQSREDSESKESSRSSQAAWAGLCVAFLSKSEMDVKVNELVNFLLFKYLMKEPVTKAEMLSNAIGDYQEHFHVIFTKASLYMQMVFGIDIKVVKPASQTYILVTALELTYDGMMPGSLGFPKTGLLVMVICIIFTEGNSVSEEKLWEMLSNVGLYAGKDHFIYGEPRKLIYENFVQEGYLEFRWVPGSDPARYEFLWGLRTLAETSKMKVLEFLTNINGSDPRSYPSQYAEALREEKERA